MIFIVKTETKTDVENWLSVDPYRATGLTDKTMIKPFIWVIGAPADA